VEELTADPYDTNAPKQDPDQKPNQINPLPVRGFRGGGVLFLKAPDGLNQDQADIDNGRAENCTERDNEADFAERVVWPKPSDTNEIRC